MDALAGIIGLGFFCFVFISFLWLIIGTYAIRIKDVQIQNSKWSAFKVMGPIGIHILNEQRIKLKNT